MPNPAAEKKAIEIVDASMDQEFDEEADAAAWLVNRIAVVVDEAEPPGRRQPHYPGGGCGAMKQNSRRAGRFTTSCWIRSCTISGTISVR